MLATVGQCFGCNSGSKYAQELSEASSFETEGKYEDAMEIYKEVVEKDNKNIDAYCGAFRVAVELEDIDYATAIITAANKSLEDEKLIEFKKLSEDALATTLQNKIRTADYASVMDIVAISDRLLDEEGAKSARTTTAKRLQSVADSAAQQMDYDTALTCCDYALQIDEECKDAKNMYVEVLKAYFARTLFDGDVVIARELYDKYSTRDMDIDFHDWKKRLEYAEETETLIHQVIHKAIELMSQKEFIGMLQVDGSTNTNRIVQSFHKPQIVFDNNCNEAPNLTGKGIGIYRFNGNGYYFYYGDYLNGQREGLGYTFCLENDTEYTSFDGTWENDAPNGSGTLTQVYDIGSKDEHSIIRTGTYENGLENGQMSVQVIEKNGKTGKGAYTSSNGGATDIFEQLSKDYLVEETKNQHKYGASIYCVEDMNTDFYWHSYNPYTQSLGVLEFNEIPYYKDARAEYSSNMYKIGDDLKEGTYILFSDNTRNLAYFCLSADANQLNIIENDNFPYNQIIEVKDGEYLELIGCYAKNLFCYPNINMDGEGVFPVGTYLAEGEYKLETNAESGYYAVYSDYRHEKIVKNDNFSGQRYVSVKNGQLLELVRCSIEKNQEETRTVNDSVTGYDWYAGNNLFIPTPSSCVNGITDRGEGVIDLNGITMYAYTLAKSPVMARELFEEYKQVLTGFEGAVIEEQNDHSFKFSYANEEGSAVVIYMDSGMGDYTMSVTFDNK